MDASTNKPFSATPPADTMSADDFQSLFAQLDKAELELRRVLMKNKEKPSYTATVTQGQDELQAIRDLRKNREFMRRLGLYLENFEEEICEAQTALWRGRTEQLETWKYTMERWMLGLKSQIQELEAARIRYGQAKPPYRSPYPLPDTNSVNLTSRDSNSADITEDDSNPIVSTTDSIPAKTPMNDSDETDFIWSPMLNWRVDES